MRLHLPPPAQGDTKPPTSNNSRLRHRFSCPTGILHEGTRMRTRLMKVDSVGWRSIRRRDEKELRSRGLSSGHFDRTHGFCGRLVGSGLVHVGQGLQPHRNGALVFGCGVCTYNGHRFANFLPEQIPMAGVYRGARRGWWFDFPLLHRSLQRSRAVRSLVSPWDAGLRNRVLRLRRGHQHRRSA